MATTPTTHGGPVIKNLLIKDASGNTQLIEVIQTGPGKFVTTSGHSIKTAPGASGGKTLIRTAPPANTVQTTRGQQIFITTSATGATTITSIAQPTTPGHQIIRTTTAGGAAGILKNSPARQIMAIPIQPNPGTPTTILKAANIKTEFGTPPTQATIIQRATPGTVVGSPMMQQIIQAGNQRLLLTQTPNGPQLTPLTSASITQLGQHQLAQFITPGQGSPNLASTIAVSGIGPTLNLSKQSFISPILDHTGARKRVDFPSDVSYESKRRKAEKGGKGLRHFSMKVCEKVRTKGLTTYNEVADELVNEFASPAMGLSQIEQQFDQKNIRRRVYDALNVLMAMNIISKEKKEIKWLGLPTNSMQECTTLEKDRQKRIERLKAKTQQLHDLIIQQVAFKSLVERNKAKEKDSGPPQAHGSIHLPFLIVNTNKQTVIDCSISSDKMEYLFNFDGTFEIHDDIEVLKRMGLALGLDKNVCTDEDIAQAKRILPKALEDYVDQIGKRTEDWKADFGNLEYDDSYFPPGADGDMDPDNVENMYDVSGHSLTNDSVDGLSSMNMSVEDLEMQAAIASLQGQSSGVMDDDDPDLGGDEEDDYEDDDDVGMSD